MFVLFSCAFLTMQGFTASVGAQDTETLEFVTGNDFKPFSDQTLPGGGLATDILTSVLEESGVGLNLTWSAWDAGFEESARGNFAGTLPYYFTEERAKTHLFSDPIYSIDRLLFYRHDRIEAPVQLDDIAGRAVCLPVGYAVPPSLEPLIEQDRIDFTQPLDMTRCFELLALGQVDYVVNHPLQGWDLVRETRDLSPDNVRVSDFILESNQLHIIISKAHDDAERYLALINAGLSAIRDNGVYDQLIAKHIDGPGGDNSSIKSAEQPGEDNVSSNETVRLGMVDGSQLVGTIIEQNDQSIRLQTQFGIIDVPMAMVAEPASSETTGEQSPSPQSLQLAGSNTIGSSLALRLIEGFTEEWEHEFVEWQISDPSTVKAIIAGGGPSGLRSVTIEAQGSSTGFQALRNGDADLAMASRPIKPEEATALASRGDMTSANAEHVIGLDGIAVIVHPDNLITTLSRDQIAQIFSGQITRWRDLVGSNNAGGSEDDRIELLVRDAQSSTFDSFVSLILGDPARLALDAERYSSSAELSDQVALRPNAIGFGGLGQVRNARALAIDECGISANPTAFAVKSEEYPLARRLFFYRPPDSSNPWSGPLIEFTASDQGQDIVEDEGFIGLGIEPRDASSQKTFFTSLDQRPAQVLSTIDDFKTAMAGAQRLSTTFRFRTGSARLDARALRDLRRLARYAREQDIDPKRLILAGFADGRGGYQTNLELSQRRAQAVASWLTTEGLAVEEAYGFSEEIPVACDTEENGWALNRRVEVWLKP